MKFLPYQLCLALALLLSVTAGDVLAQGAPPWSCPLPSNTPAGTRDSCFQWFNRGGKTGFNKPVSSVEVLKDGKILCYSSSDSLGGRPIKGVLTRLFSNGELDTTFSTGYLSDSSFSLISNINILSSGKILIAVEYLIDGRFGAQKIIRLNSNGSFDPTFKWAVPQTNVPGSAIVDIYEQPTGKVIFSYYTSWPAYSYQFSRVNSNGTEDNTFFSISRE